MATSARRPSPDGNLLRPRPLRALPEALRSAGHGLNGFAEVPSAVSRYGSHLLGLSHLHARYSSLLTVDAQHLSLTMHPRQFNQFPRPGDRLAPKQSIAYSTPSITNLESPTSTPGANTETSAGSLFSSGSA